METPYEYMELRLVKQKARITELETKLADYKDDISKVLDEKCPSDERHCGCVPILRQRIDKYQTALVLITTMRELSQAITIANNALNERGKYPLAEQSVGDYWVGQLEQLEAQLAEARVENETLLNRLCWISVNDRLPNHTDMVEVCQNVLDNEPPFWALSHGFYMGGSWQTRTGWYHTVEYWRESEHRALRECALSGETGGEG
jgi:hypothetical protein